MTPQPSAEQDTQQAKAGASPAPARCGPAPPSSSHQSTTDNAASDPLRLRYISAEDAVAIDQQLMGPTYAFSIDQLMELAGLACAQTVYETYPADSFTTVLVACGPGNQGGDGLVAARHLHHFGYNVQVWYPKAKSSPLFDRLRTQLNTLRIPFVPAGDFEDAYEECDVVLDCIFGFSFKGPPRAPFKEAIELLTNESIMEFEFRRKRPPIVSIDMPSSWDVDQGNVNNSFVPHVLLSLTAPKIGAAKFQGQHFVGGRFVPDELDREFDLFLPAFPGTSQIVDITGAQPLTEDELPTLRSQRDRGSVSTGRSSSSP